MVKTDPDNLIVESSEDDNTSGTQMNISAPPDTTAPSTPTNVTATTLFSSIGITWNSSTDNVGVTGYKIYKNGNLLASPNNSATSYTDSAASGFTPNTTYAYYIRAVDAAGNISSQSTSASATTPPALNTATTTSTTGVMPLLDSLAATLQAIQQMLQNLKK